jgi:hypothetical protein
MISGHFWKAPMRSPAVGVTFMVITAGFIGGLWQEFIHLSKAPCVIQLEICAEQLDAQLHPNDATMFATVSGPAFG